MIIEYNFRFAFTPGWSGIMNMGADRFFGETSPPDLPFVRFYTWDKPTISYGCNQNPAKRIDLEACQHDGIPVVQRPTGGRELLHGHDLCYCVAMPCRDGINAVEARKLFMGISDILINALARLGINAKGTGLGIRTKAIQGPCFAQTDAGEITINGRKLIASAQRVFDRCVIQEGSVPLCRPEVDLIKYLCLQNKEKLRFTMETNTAYLYDNMNKSVKVDSISESFKDAFSLHFSGPVGPAQELLTDFQRNNKSVLRYY